MDAVVATFDRRCEIFSVAGLTSARAFATRLPTCAGMILILISCDPNCDREFQVGDELQITLVERIGGEMACGDAIGLREGVVLNATIREFGGGDQDCAAAMAEIDGPEGWNWDLAGKIVGDNGDLLGSYQLTHQNCSARVSLALSLAGSDVRFRVDAGTCADNCPVFYAIDVQRR